MRTILKQVEPEGFISWKSANRENIDRFIAEGKTGDKIWELLPSSLSQEIVPNDYAKSELRDALVKEQFFICCYCNDAIKRKPLDTKIEHFLPKETYKQTIFDYQNLLAACNGGEREPERPRKLHCDTHKGSRDPSQLQLVSPFDSDASTHFLFRENGEIFGKTPKGKETISFLNLDCPKLNLRRKSAIEMYLYDETEDFGNQIKEVIKPVDGKLQAFCMAVLSVLESYC
jgi:uncharacterized protein (TIGR02646 family)